MVSSEEKKEVWTVENQKSPKIIPKKESNKKIQENLYLQPPENQNYGKKNCCANYKCNLS